MTLEPQVYDRLQREDIGGFSSWVYPDATAGQVRALSDFHQWVVGLDDQMDRRTTLDTNLSACTMLESLGTVELAPFDDIFTRMRALDMTDRCAEQFLKAMHLYGASSRQEVKACEGQTGFASLPDYVANRRASAAMPVYFALVTWISRIDLPDEIYQHPLVRLLENACSDYAMLYNDAGSFIKEYLAGRSEGTFVRLLSEQHGLSVQDTLYEIADMAAAAADDLEAASDQIEDCDLPAHQREQVHRYADGLRKYTGGVNRWSNHTCRYLIGQPLTTMPPTSDKGDIHHLRDHAG
ncbi:terpene synthase family protein [Streptomyces sp. NPDC004126]|uniref:terpene synthase family protein n=1 Tax=Streptomyces sp. NPDC004126 TaxID=3390695 RepID=UPI003D02B512